MAHRNYFTPVSQLFAIVSDLQRNDHPPSSPFYPMKINHLSFLAQGLVGQLRLTMEGHLSPRLLLACAAFVAAQPIHASLVVTYAELPADVKSTLANTAVLDFDSVGATQGAKPYSNLTWTDPTQGTIGTLDHVYLQNANAYGGANYPNAGGYYAVQSSPSQYAVGGANAVSTTTLALAAPSEYFGIWWSAGDAANTLTFYDGPTKIAEYTTATLPGLLPGTYFGNPVDGRQDGSEPFAFLNFYALHGTKFTSVVFSEPGSSYGFESDNWTVRAQGWGTSPGETGPVPGVLLSEISSVPEPSSTLALGGLLASALLLRNRTSNSGKNAAF